MLRFIRLDTNNKVIAVRSGKEIVQGETQSDAGEIGQIMQLDGTFITPEVEPVKPQPTIEEEILFETKYQTMILEMGGM